MTTLEDRCWYCDQTGVTDHKHGSCRSCGDCCATHGSLCHTDSAAYRWVEECIKAKNERLAAQAKRITELESEIVQLRDGLADAIARGKEAREMVERLSAPISIGQWADDGRIVRWRDSGFERANRIIRARLAPPPSPDANVKDHPPSES